MDHGLATIRDGYMASQILDICRQVWQSGLGLQKEEQHLRTFVDFLFGNSMLLRLSNRLPIELPDIFSMSLVREGPKGDRWWLVTVIGSR